MNDHRCAAENRCRDAVLSDGDQLPWRGALIEAPRGLCRRCFNAVRGATECAVSDFDRLSAAIGEHIETGATKVSGTREPPMPLNATVVALRSSLSEWYEAAMWMVAETLGVDVKVRHRARGWPVREAPIVVQAHRVLPENLAVLLDAPVQPISVWASNTSVWYVRDMDGVDVALRLLSLHHQVDSVLGETNARRRLAMPCPILDCGARGTLGIDDGQTDVNCTACGGRWTQREYDWLANLLVSEHREQETAVLQWLLAEKCYQLAVAQWLLAQRDQEMCSVKRLARMQPGDLDDIDTYTVIELLRELVGTDCETVALASR